MGKKIVAARTLPAGHTLAREDLALKSPADGGLPPYELDAVIGRTLRHPVGEDAAFTFDDLEELIPGTVASSSVRAADGH
jgi:N-acetylneuraminate synthase/sialic acid synthase